MAGWGSVRNMRRIHRELVAVAIVLDTVREAGVNMNQQFQQVRDAMIALRDGHPSPVARIEAIEARLDALEAPPSP